MSAPAPRVPRATRRAAVADAALAEYQRVCARVALGEATSVELLEAYERLKFAR